MTKVILSCFAGRRRYLEILSVYIDILLHKNLIDEVHIWDYTRDETDAKWIRERWPQEYIFEVQDKSTFVEYYKFYNKERYPEDDTVLLKCDDDIVYIDIEEFGRFISKRRQDIRPLIMTACVINNPFCSLFLIYNTDLLDDDKGEFVMFNPEHAKFMHEKFLNGSVKKKESCRYFNTLFPEFKLNINFIAILSRDFGLVSRRIGAGNDEDEFAHACILTERPILMDSHFFVSHMAYKKQRDDGFDETDFLERYTQLKNKTLLKYKDE